ITTNTISIARQDLFFEIIKVTNEYLTKPITNAIKIEISQYLFISANKIEPSIEELYRKQKNYQLASNRFLEDQYNVYLIILQTIVDEVEQEELKNLFIKEICIDESYINRSYNHYNIHERSTTEEVFNNALEIQTNETNLPKIPLFTQILQHTKILSEQKPAIIDVKAETSHSYRKLVSDIIELRKRLLKNAETSIEDLKEARVAFLCPNGYDYVVSQWSIWSAGGIAVPLCTTHPLPELLYVLNDSQSTILITHSDFQEKVNSIAREAGIKKVITVCDKDQKYDGANFKPPSLIPMDDSRRAMIIYTSGTTELCPKLQIKRLASLKTKTRPKQALPSQLSTP
ncbi:10644_t:CDS:2, partial [Scutellospora calospora]